MSSKKLVPKERGVNLDRLTDKQRLFVDMYLTTTKMNAAEAARLAGYTAPNAGAKLISNKLVAAAIGKSMKDRSERTKVESDAVLREIASIGLCNIQDCLDENGKFIPPHKLPRHVAAAVYSVEWRIVRDPLTNEPIGREVSNYTFWDKLTSLQLLARHLGMLDPKFGTNEGVSADTLLSTLLSNVQANNSAVVDGEVIEALALEDNTDDEE